MAKANKKKIANALWPATRFVFTLYRTFYTNQKWLLSLPRYAFILAGCKSVVVSCARRSRASVFGSNFFKGREKKNAGKKLTCNRSRYAHLAISFFLRPGSETRSFPSHAKTLTSVSLHRPPNSRSSRLFPANSRTAPSPRYACIVRFCLLVRICFFFGCAPPSRA